MNIYQFSTKYKIIVSFHTQRFRIISLELKFLYSNLQGISKLLILIKSTLLHNSKSNQARSRVH